MQDLLPLDDRISSQGEKRTAIFSQQRVYRYTLEIKWDASLPLLMCIGLNPSTADEVDDDPTLRRVKRFARDWNYGGIIMTNLFAFRSTDPKVMLSHPRPIGDRNNTLLKTSRERAAFCLCAWGNHGRHLNRADWVLENLSDLHALKITGAGCPQHPLYLPANTKPFHFK